MLAQHWKRFAKQPYFDKHGIFFSAIVSTPMLLTMFFLLVRTPVSSVDGRLSKASVIFQELVQVNYLASASSLLVKMKRKELRYKARQRARQEAEATGKRKDM